MWPIKRWAGLNLGLCVLAIAGFQNCAQTGFRGVASSLATAAVVTPPMMKLGDRSYVASVFLSVFGSSAAVQAAVNGLIQSRPSVFGGPCRQFEMSDFHMNWSNGQGPSYYVGENACGDDTGAVASTQVAASPLREIYKISTCDKLIALRGDATGGFDYAVSQVGGVVGKPPAAQQIEALYEKFNPGRATSDDELTAVINVITQVPEAKDQWVVALTVLCHDPTWESM